MSLDGYIAKKNDNIDFLSMVETANEDYGYADHLQNIDTINSKPPAAYHLFSF